MTVTFKKKILKRLMKEKGWSATQLVAELSKLDYLVDRQNVESWLKGSQPTFQYVAGLCKVFNVPVEYFSGE